MRLSMVLLDVRIQVSVSQDSEGRPRMVTQKRTHRLCRVLTVAGQESAVSGAIPFVSPLAKIKRSLFLQSLLPRAVQK